MVVSQTPIMTAQTLSRRTSQRPAVTPAAHYAVYGLQVLSDVRLPIPTLPGAAISAVRWAVRRAAPGQTVTLPAGAPMSEDRAEDGTLLDQFYRVGDEAWLWDARAGVCHMEPRRGRVTVYPTAETDEDDLGLLILGPVFSYMLHQTGLPNLHASAVVTPYDACAFVGPSTLGKSTLAAGLLRRGADLLTDDILPLRFRPHGVYGVPGAAMMKVWPGTMRQTLGLTDELPRLTSFTEKRLFTLDEHHHTFAQHEARLRAVYVPDRYDPVQERRTDVVIERLSPRDAVLMLLSQTFRGHYLLPQELAELMVRYRQLAGQARVAVLRLPHGLEYADRVSEAILQDMAAS